MGRTQLQYNKRRRGGGKGGGGRKGKGSINGTRGGAGRGCAKGQSRDAAKYQRRAIGTNAHKFEEFDRLNEKDGEIGSVAVLIDDDQDENGYGNSMGIYHGEIGLQSINFEREWGEQAETAESFFPPGTLVINMEKIAQAFSNLETEALTPASEESLLDNLLQSATHQKCEESAPLKGTVAGEGASVSVGVAAKASQPINDDDDESLLDELLAM